MPRLTKILILMRDRVDHFRIVIRQLVMREPFFDTRYLSLFKQYDIWVYLELRYAPRC